MWLPPLLVSLRQSCRFKMTWKHTMFKFGYVVLDRTIKKDCKWCEKLQIRLVCRFTFMDLRPESRQLYHWRLVLRIKTTFPSLMMNGINKKWQSQKAVWIVRKQWTTWYTATTSGGSWSRSQRGELYCCYSLCCIWTATSCRAGNVGLWLYVQTWKAIGGCHDFPLFGQSLHQGEHRFVSVSKC